jgi:SAM-dependent methyltransferase
VVVCTDWFGVATSAEEDERLAAIYDLDARSTEATDAAIDWFRGLAQMTGGPILELGVGSGRVAVPIAKDGHEVVGVDRSAAMLARAERYARTARTQMRLVQADMRTFSLDRAFALITIPFNTFLMLTPEDRWACLARCREHLDKAGRVAIDVFQPDPSIIAGVDGGVREEWRRQDAETGHMITKFSSTRATVDGTTFRWWWDEELGDGQIRRIGREATLHFLYRREAELLFPAAGFEIDTFHGDYDGGPAGPTARKLLIVLRRRERGSGRERRTR